MTQPIKLIVAASLLAILICILLPHLKRESVVRQAERYTSRGGTPIAQSASKTLVPAQKSKASHADASNDAIKSQLTADQIHWLQARELLFDDEVTLMTAISLYWSAQVASSDKNISDAAFEIIAEACMSDSPSDNTNINAISTTLNTFNVSLQSSWEYAKGRGWVLNVLNAARARLIHGQDSEKKAQMVIKRFSGSIYEDKSDEWWKTEFPKSKLAAILENLDLEEIKNRTE